MATIRSVGKGGNGQKYEDTGERRFQERMTFSGAILPTPLWPAGHLPHKGGDQQARRGWAGTQPFRNPIPQTFTSCSTRPFSPNILM